MRQMVTRRIFRPLRWLALAAAGRVVVRLSRSLAGQTLLFNAIRLQRREALALGRDPGVRFVAYVLLNRGRSQSQLLQDLWVCFELKEKRNGYFVEFGATDGRTNSNTWLLEKMFGWEGILAEPNPLWHGELSANRVARIDHRCVSSVSGATVDFIATNTTDPELSGIAAYSQGAHFDLARRQGDLLRLTTVSLDDLLDAHDAPAVIDYMSIDTEGSELEILEAFDFSLHRPKLLSVEFNTSSERPIEDLLSRHNYVRVFAHLSQWEGWYVSRDIRSAGHRNEVDPPQNLGS